MQLSGHKNIESLNHYNIASKAHQRNMSNILNNATPCSSKQQTSTPIPSSNSSSTRKSDQIIHLPNDNYRKQTFEASNSRLTLNNSKARSSEDTVGSLFRGATLSNNVFHINIVQKFNKSPAKKRKYVIYDSSDSDSD